MGTGRNGESRALRGELRLIHGRRTGAPASSDAEPTPGTLRVLRCYVRRNEVGARWHLEEGRVVVTFPKRLTRFERKLQDVLGGPTDLRVPLDDAGSYVWLRCDGATPLARILGEVATRHGAQVEPVGVRILRFVELLAERGLVELSPTPLDRIALPPGVSLEPIEAEPRWLTLLDQPLPQER